MLSNPELDDQGLDVIDAFTPALQALLDGQGDTVVITSSLVHQAQAFLDALLPYASLSLQQDIADEQEQHPLERYVGMNMDQAFENIVDITPPVVVSSVRLNNNPTSALSVNYTVIFSESVTGVGINDFGLTTDIVGALVTGVNGSGNTYTVTVNTGSGDGAIRLDVLSNATIVDNSLNPLSSGFTSGETYTIDNRQCYQSCAHPRIPPLPLT